MYYASLERQMLSCHQMPIPREGMQFLGKIIVLASLPNFIVSLVLVCLSDKWF